MLAKRERRKYGGLVCRRKRMPGIDRARRDDFAMPEGQNMIGGASVSYTHLDVYKRQD